MTTLDEGMNPAGVGHTEGTFSASLHGLMRLLRLMHLHQRTIAWCVAGTLVFATAYYIAAPRLYRSTAKLLIIDQNAENLSATADGGRADDVMATHRELVRSPVVLQRAIEHLPAEHRVDLENVNPSRWIDKVSGALYANTVRRTKFVEVGYTSLKPEAAVAVVNEVINSYLRYVEETHRSTAAEMLEVLNEEKLEIERDLAKKQQLQQQFRERCGHLAIDQKDSVVDPLIGRALHLNDSLMEAQQNRLELQASLATVDVAASTGQDMRQYLAVVEEAVGEKMVLSALGMGQQDLELIAKQQERLIELESEQRRIAPYYGPNHESMRALASQVAGVRQFLASYQTNAADRFKSMNDQQVGAFITQALRRSVAQAIEKERVLSVSFEQARHAATRQSSDLVQLEMLNREVGRLESLHDVLFNKIAAVDIHQIQAPIRISIVKEPLPEETPVSPRFATLYAGAILGGVLIGVGIVFVRDQLDDRFASPDEIAQQLGVPVLSVVRQLQTLSGKSLDGVHMHVNGNSVEAEAFRTLRTSLTLQGEMTERIVISSAEPSDGKTTISSNLAVAFAQVGKRTLVIDCDLRKPGMTALMDLKGAAGVTDILTCNSSVSEQAEQCLVKTAMPNLDVIPAGPRRPDAAELLSGSNFMDLLAWAEGRYDQVLVDCPPVLAVSDAQIVGRMVDGVIVVVTPEKNHRRLVSRACESFASSGCNVLGVVANRISNRSEGGYGYGYGYGTQYGYGHGGEESQQAMADDPGLEESAAITPDSPAWRRLVGGADQKKAA